MDLRSAKRLQLAARRGQSLTKDSVAAAGRVAPQLGSSAGKYLSEVSNAFLSGLAVACIVVATVAAAGSAQ